MATDARIVLVTVPAVSDEEKEKVGEQLARTLVEERLAACVNRVPNLMSTYRWQGKVETAIEELLLIKTTARHVKRLTARVKELHPYDVPEVLVLTVASGLDAYLNWVRESCG